MPIFCGLSALPKKANNGKGGVFFFFFLDG